MTDIQDIASHFRKYLGEVTLGGAEVKAASIYLGQPYVKANWFCFHFISSDTSETTSFEICASEHRNEVVHYPEYDTGEDGIEPAYDKSSDYYFLKLSEIKNEDPVKYSFVEFPMGIVSSIDIFAATFQIDTQAGRISEERFCGFRFNLSHGDGDGFGLLQTAPVEDIRMGTEAIFSEIPSHIRLAMRLE